MSINDNRVALLQLAYNLSQEKLSSQANSAIGADARAMSFSGLCLTAGALLIGLSNSGGNSLSNLIGAGALIVAAGIAAFAARPIAFRFPGANFSDLASDIAENAALEDVLKELGSYAEKHINENNRLLSENATSLRQSIYVAMTGMIVALFPPFLNLAN